MLCVVAVKCIVDYLCIISSYWIELPKKRLEKKREQLENLVTAVIDIAKPGDVIVDFCSGGVCMFFW